SSCPGGGPRRPRRAQHPCRAPPRRRARGPASARHPRRRPRAWAPRSPTAACPTRPRRARPSQRRGSRRRPVRGSGRATPTRTGETRAGGRRGAPSGCRGLRQRRGTATRRTRRTRAARGRRPARRCSRSWRPCGPPAWPRVRSRERTYALTPRRARDPARRFTSSGTGLRDPATGLARARPVPALRAGGSGRGAWLLRRRALGGLLLRRALLLGRVEPVADVAHRADQLLVLRAELGAQAPHVHVHGAGAAVVVVAPDLLEQLGAGEHAARVLHEVLEELELLVREVDGAAAQPGRVPARVDRELARGDLLLRLLGRAARGALHDEAQARLHLGRGGGLEQQVVRAPLVRDDG